MLYSTFVSINLTLKMVDCDHTFLTQCPKMPFLKLCCICNNIQKCKYLQVIRLEIETLLLKPPLILFKCSCDGMVDWVGEEISDNWRIICIKTMPSC